MSTALLKALARIVPQPVALASDSELRLVYVRRKPARGLVALYAGGHPMERVACVSIDEQALREDGLEACPTLRWFPDDPALPGLGACCDPTPDQGLWAALERAACRAAGTKARLIGARAERLRYKPGDRCVLRFGMTLDAADGRGLPVSVIGKAYREPEKARCAHAIAEKLHSRPSPVVARPLGLVGELGVVLSQDVGESFSIPGTLVLRPLADCKWPDQGLRGAAAALAAFHACPPTEGCRPQPATREAEKAVARADLLARSVPALAGRLRCAGRLIAEALVETPASDRCLVHGSFKPSQLLFSTDGRAVIIDLDHCCVADPALDLGYFLAYLRPAALWQRRGGARAWYEAAASCFRRAYTAARGAGNAQPRDVEGILVRAALYEAAVLLKIATRRVHRLNSPRPRELEAIIDEAVACVNACRSKTR